MQEVGKEKMEGYGESRFLGLGGRKQEVEEEKMEEHGVSTSLDR